MAGNGAVWTYAYDQRGLLAQEQMGIDGQILRADYQYDDIGRVAARTYPSGYAVRYAHSPTDGELTRIDGTDGQPLWRRGAEDALGRPLSETIGNHLGRTHVYTPMGHLERIEQGGISRRYAYDTATGSITRREADGPLLGLTVERFDYDALDRLSGINGAWVLYDQRGNITQMPGVGAMQHAGYQLNALTAQAGFAKPEIDIKYAANGRARELRRSSLSVKHETINPKPILDPLPRPIRPNEEHTITGIKDLIPKPKQPTIRTITDYTDHKWHVTFGPAGQRIRSVEDSTRIISIEVNDGLSEPIKINKNYTATRYYATNHEREIANGKTTDYTYIQSPNGLVAAIKTTGTQHDAMLIATDHLGSLIGVWNASGTLLEEHRYTAWGLRTSSTDTPRLRRGFTGHEHLTQFGLIDMQARLYDPHLGRFLAPDPYVQAPDNHQSLNRYIYCMNNPLKYVDPDGEFWHIVIGAAVGGLVNWISNGCEFSWKGLAYFGVGAAVGAASAAVGGWAAGTFNVSGIITGGAVGAAVGGITGGASSFALNGGNNLIAGNNFFDNWWSATKSGLISGAITGGIDGGIRGGKLALQRDRNAWWGTEKKHGRGNWSFFNSEKPHTVVDFDFKSVHSNMDNACVPESLTELEQHFGGTKSFDEFATECGYIPNKGTPSHMVPISINNNFDALYYDGIHIAETLSNSTSMANLASEGGIATLNMGKYIGNMGHLDNIRSIRYYSNKITIKLRVGSINLDQINNNSTVMYIVRALKFR